MRPAMQGRVVVALAAALAVGCGFLGQSGPQPSGVATASPAAVEPSPSPPVSVEPSPGSPGSPSSPVAPSPGSPAPTHAGGAQNVAVLVGAGDIARCGREGDESTAVLLDRIPGAEKGADALIGVGVVTALPAATAGLVDWSEQNPQHARVGVVHATANTAGLALFVGSLAARQSGRRRLGKALALLGAAQVGVGGLLGGHISFHQAGGPSHVSDLVDRVPSGWHRLCDFDELPDGSPVRKMLDDVPVFVLREGTGAHVLADVCSHLSGPLSDGELTGAGADRCVVCPWHGSTFRIADGSVVHGPATAPQPAFDARVRDGVLEVALRS